MRKYGETGTIDFNKLADRANAITTHIKGNKEGKPPKITITMDFEGSYA